MARSGILDFRRSRFNSRSPRLSTSMGFLSSFHRASNFMNSILGGTSTSAECVQYRGLNKQNSCTEEPESSASVILPAATAGKEFKTRGDGFLQSGAPSLGECGSYYVACYVYGPPDFLNFPSLRMGCSDGNSPPKHSRDPTTCRFCQYI